MPNAHAESYYAEIDINVDTSGFVTIDGYTNHPYLLVKDSQNYTSKNKSYWILHISTDEIFSAFIYTIRLPKGAVIHSIDSSGMTRITNNEGFLIVKGYSEDSKLYIMIKYEIEKETVIGSGYEWFLLGAIIVATLSLVILYLYKRNPSTRETSENTDINLKDLNKRQREIINILTEIGTPLTQTEIEKRLNIPKASVSRNIRTLERKGLIVKEQKGMSNLISLKKH
ncbi:MAG: MarR family transcriptional regulator [Candidatus Thermoplasmatota archaeon]